MQSIWNFSGFQWWIKRKRSQSLKGFLFILVFTIFFAACFIGPFISMGIQNVDSGAIMVLGFMSLIFIFILWSQLKELIRYSSKSLEAEAYWLGDITGMDIEIKRSGKKRKRIYWIEADVSGKRMDGVCTLTTYNKAEIGQEILLFTFNGDKIFAVHPEM